MLFCTVILFFYGNFNVFLFSYTFSTDCGKDSGKMWGISVKPSCRTPDGKKSSKKHRLKVTFITRGIVRKNGPAENPNGGGILHLCFPLLKTLWKVGKTLYFPPFFSKKWIIPVVIQRFSTLLTGFSTVFRGNLHRQNNPPSMTAGNLCIPYIPQGSRANFPCSQDK